MGLQTLLVTSHIEVVIHRLWKLKSAPVSPHPLHTHIHTQIHTHTHWHTHTRTHARTHARTHTRHTHNTHRKAPSTITTFVCGIAIRNWFILQRWVESEQTGCKEMGVAWVLYPRYTHFLATSLAKAKGHGLLEHVKRAQELCKSAGGRPGLPVPNSPYCLRGRLATLNSEHVVCHRCRIGLLFIDLGRVPVFTKLAAQSERDQ